MLEVRLGHGLGLRAPAPASGRGSGSGSGIVCAVGLWKGVTDVLTSPSDRA
jgi:hypothetical protein